MIWVRRCDVAKHRWCHNCPRWISWAAIYSFTSMYVQWPIAISFRISNRSRTFNFQTGDDEAEEEDRALKIRRVNTALGMSTMHEMRNHSFHKLQPPSLDWKQQPLDIGIQMSSPTKKTFVRRFIELMDPSLLKDPYFLNLLFGLSIFYVAEMNFKMVTPFFFASLGYSKAEVAYCLSVTAISDIAARIILPPICDRFQVKKRLIFFVSILFVGVTRSSKSSNAFQ